MNKAQEIAPLAIFSLNELSPYAQFHFTFLGKTFKNKLTGKSYTKLQVFLKDQIEAITMAQTGLPSDKYYLVDSPGWRNGVNFN